MSSSIDVKTAVRHAIAYLLGFEEFIAASDIRLEETEYDDRGYWLITLSSIEKRNPLDPLASIISRPARNYKVSHRRFYWRSQVDEGPLVAAGRLSAFYHGPC